MCRIHALKKRKQLGYIKKRDLWIPYQFKEIHLTQRITICNSLHFQFTMIVNNHVIIVRNITYMLIYIKF